MHGVARRDADAARGIEAQMRKSQFTRAIATAYTIGSAYGDAGSH